MTPAELKQLLITHTPDVAGSTAAAPRDDENPYGLTVTLAGGGRAWWTITGASPTGSVRDSAPSGADPAPLPDLTGRPVPLARSSGHWSPPSRSRQATMSAASTATAAAPEPPAVRYRATIGCRDGWKLFLSCYGTTRPGQPRPGQPYHPGSRI